MFWLSVLLSCTSNETDGVVTSALPSDISNSGGLLNESLVESRMVLAEIGGRRSSGRTDDRTEEGVLDFELQSQG